MKKLLYTLIILFVCNLRTNIAAAGEKTSSKSSPVQSGSAKKNKGLNKKKHLKQHRVVNHKKAYKKRDLGNYINFKVTPPEKRGKAGQVAVEIYNFSKTYVTLMHLFIILETNNFLEIEAELTIENMSPNWGDIRWIKIPLSKGTIPKISKVTIRKMEMFDKGGNRVKMKHNTDLIKN